jgi:hypothetical protein
MQSCDAIRQCDWEITVQQLPTITEGPTKLDGVSLESIDQIHQFLKDGTTDLLKAMRALQSIRSVADIGKYPQHTAVTQRLAAAEQTLVKAIQDMRRRCEQHTATEGAAGGGSLREMPHHSALLPLEDSNRTRASLDTAIQYKRTDVTVSQSIFVRNNLNASPHPHYNLSTLCFHRCAL